MTSKQAPGNAATRVEVRYSWPRVILGTALFVWASGWVAFWAILGAFGGHALAIVVGILALLVGVPLLLPFAGAVIHPWRHSGPVLVLDADGVTDVRKANSFIPWTDIRSIRLGVGATAGFLGFVFRRPDRAREDPPRLGVLGTFLRRSAFLGDWNVSLRLLACRRQDLLQAARRLHQQGLRRWSVEPDATRAAGNDRAGSRP